MQTPEAPTEVELNAADAAARGVRDGDLVEVSSPREVVFTGGGSEAAADGRH